MVTIDATYYDTENLRLAKAGVEVCRTDAEWVATLPAGDGRGREVRFPIGTAEPEQVPAELSTLLAAYAGGRGLEAGARVSIERDRWQLTDDDGTVLADVLSDQLTGRALAGRAVHLRSWQETEVEPRGESPAARERMARRLARSGWPRGPRRNPLATLTGTGPAEIALGKKPSVADVLRRYLHEQLTALRVADVALRLGDADGVHDLRVAVRRLRSALRVFGDYLDPASLRHGRAELAWLFEVLGNARDVEVLRQQITDSLHALPAELVLGPVWSELDRFLAKREARATAAIDEAIASTRYIALQSLLDDLTVDRGGKKGTKKALRKKVRKSSKKLRSAVDEASRADGAAHDAALHSVRKKAKRLRYTCEIVEPVLGKSAKQVRRGSKRIQEILGDHHDSVEVRAVLRKLGARAHLDGSNGFTFGLLHGQAGERARRQENEFAAQWRSLSR